MTSLKIDQQDIKSMHVYGSRCRCRCWYEHLGTSRGLSSRTVMVVERSSNNSIIVDRVSKRIDSTPSDSSNTKDDNKIVEVLGSCLEEDL